MFELITDHLHADVQKVLVGVLLLLGATFEETDFVDELKKRIVGQVMVDETVIDLVREVEVNQVTDPLTGLDIERHHQVVHREEMGIAIGHQVLHGAQPLPRSLDRERQEDSEKERGRTRKVADNAYVAPVGTDEIRGDPDRDCHDDGRRRYQVAVSESHRPRARSHLLILRRGRPASASLTAMSANNGFTPEVKAIDLSAQIHLIHLEFSFDSSSERTFPRAIAAVARPLTLSKRTQCERIGERQFHSFA